MPISLPQGDIFERFGRSTGQGFGEGLERGTLARGIERISRDKNLTPLQQYSKLLQLPGGRDVASDIAPYIESERARRSAQTLYGEPSQPKSPNLNQNIPSEKFNRESENYLIPSNEAALNRRALEIQKQSGELYGKAYEKAQAEDVRRIAAEQGFEARNTLAENEFKKYLEKNLQKSDSDAFRDITGQMQNEYLPKVQELVAKGISPKQAALKVANDLLDFAKSRSLISSHGFFKSILSGPSQARKAVNNIRKSYEDRGQLDLFRNDLIGKVGLSPEYADTIAFPISNNADIKKDIDQIGTKHRFGKVEKLFNDITSHLGDNDSINAISLALDERGVNPDKFRNDISKKWKEGKLRLNERQVRELQNPIKSYTPTLKDLLYTNFLGHTKS